LGWFKTRESYGEQRGGKEDEIKIKKLEKSRRS
jgi:hypothetical protein